MTLQSMTGFARSQGEFEETSWVWELRSVNGKGLDLRIRVPSGYEAIETQARAMLSKLFKRGNIQISLNVNKSATATLPVVNHAAVDALMASARELQKTTGGNLPTLAEVFAMRGVVELAEAEADEAARGKRNQLIVESLKSAADDLVKVRQAEGDAIAVVLNQQIARIAELQTSIENNSSRTPQAIKAQLETQVNKLIEASGEFDEQRLYQEAAILAAKADLQEELDRLKVHVSSAKDLLSGPGPVGRQLDFLAQEFNRECNTICSKSNSAEVTSIGLDMKLIIDQFREQLQNME